MLGEDVTVDCWSNGAELDAVAIDGAVGILVEMDVVDAGNEFVDIDGGGATAAAATFAYPPTGFRGGTGALTILATDCCAKFACGRGFATRQTFSNSDTKSAGWHTFCYYRWFFKAQELSTMHGKEWGRVLTTLRQRYSCFLQYWAVISFVTAGYTLFVLFLNRCAYWQV